MSKEKLGMTEGKKYDKGKLEWSLLPMDTLEEVVKVLMYGADKYSRGNWMLVEPERYYNAAMRHLQDHWVHSKEIDEESGYSHLAHAICCLIFMEWFRQNKVAKGLQPVITITYKETD